MNIHTLLIPILNTVTPAWWEQPAIIASFIGLIGVLLSTVFGYISSYYGNQQSQKNELRKIKENQRKQIEQQTKLEKDKALRIVLQKFTYAYYNTDYDVNIYSTYFNTPQGQDIFNETMSYVTAYGRETSVQTTIYLQKAISGSQLMSSSYEKLLEIAQDDLNYEVDWVRYETNALASILIAQLRYDISQELINPKELMAVKYNNEVNNLRMFFGSGIDYFVDILNLDHFKIYEKE